MKRNAIDDWISNKTDAGRLVALIKSSDIKVNFTMLWSYRFDESCHSYLSSGKGFMPKRVVTDLKEGALSLLLKPAYASEERRVAVKILTQKENRIIKGIPTNLGLVVLMDTVTGELLSLMDGDYITALRTVAG